MIRHCRITDLAAVFSIINEAAVAYKGVIPDDRWHEPYMPLDELKTEISRGVNFWGHYDGDTPAGVMGLQEVKDVTLIRHAYVKPCMQKRGIGSKLLSYLKTLSDRPLLVGTWKAAVWAVAFYQKNGFTPVTDEEKDRLLRTYWTIPERQVETSVVLAGNAWFSRREFQ
ncbi:MAG: GNAT family N-acetyltransferase [Chitinispirillaceae bacterium]|nr:GNAT family N-acetyltransferase [Chitinispirillaceae bacterium]